MGNSGSYIAGSGKGRVGGCFFASTAGKKEQGKGQDCMHTCWERLHQETREHGCSGPKLAEAVRGATRDTLWM